MSHRSLEMASQGAIDDTGWRYMGPCFPGIKLVQRTEVAHQTKLTPTMHGPVPVQEGAFDLSMGPKMRHGTARSITIRQRKFLAVRPE